MAPQASTPAASYRFIPIEATTSASSTTSSNRRRGAKIPTQPVEEIRSFSLYQNQPQATLPSAHFNPPSAHPYFFPPVLAHQPGARLPPNNPPPASQAPNIQNGAPNHAFSSPQDNTSIPDAAPSTNPYPTTTASSFPEPTATTTTTSIAATATPPLQNPSPRTPAADPPKKFNSASRPLTHPNPHSLGLTRISPPPECPYPNAEVAATVIHAWSTSRNFKLSRQKSDKNAAGEVYKQYYLCSRHGRPTNTHKVTPETRQRRQRKSERIGCPMGLVVRAVDAGNVTGDWTVRWQLEGKSEWHNHGPATDAEVKGEEDRKERNERRKMAKGLGNGKRGRRLKDPSKPARKRDRRKKQEPGELQQQHEEDEDEDDEDVGGIAEEEAEGEEIEDGGGAMQVANGVELGPNVGGGGSGSTAEQQLQQEFSRTLPGHDLLNGSGHHHHPLHPLHPHHPPQILPHQHHHQQQQHDPTARPLPSSIWGLPSTGDMMATGLDGRARIGGPEQQSQQPPPYQNRFGRNDGMVYPPLPPPQNNHNQSGMAFR